MVVLWANFGRDYIVVDHTIVVFRPMLRNESNEALHLRVVQTGAMVRLNALYTHHVIEHVHLVIDIRDPIADDLTSQLTFSLQQ